MQSICTHICASFRPYHIYGRLACRQIRRLVSKEITSVLIQHAFLFVESQLETNGVTAKLTEVIVFAKKHSKNKKIILCRLNIYILKLRKLNFLYTDIYHCDRVTSFQRGSFESKSSGSDSIVRFLQFGRTVEY